jgi:hypothetical protein
LSKWTPVVAWYRKNGSLAYFLDRPALLRSHEVLAERKALDERLARGLGRDIRVAVGIAPFGVDVRDRQEAEELVEADVLRL